MLHKPAKGTPDYQIPLNENFTTLEDKLQYKAHCTHDPDTNLYTLSLQNIPESAAALLPAGLPDLFTVVARMPTEYTDGGKVKIGEVEFSIKYGTFASGDVVTLSVNLPEKVAFAGVGTGTESGAGAHNAVYRGKLLGNAVTDEQYAAISSGTFNDLYIGDYWRIGGVNYRIAAFDYYLRSGENVDLQTHHAVMVPDTILYNAAMNTTNTTAGGYVGSLMYTTNLAAAKTAINTAFTGHVMQHRQLLSNSVTNGRVSGVAWFDSTVELMNELMVYGNGVFTPVSNGESTPSSQTICKNQLPLFAMRPDLISNRLTYWLRDIMTSTIFAIVHAEGYAGITGNAIYGMGVRPAFSIY